MVVKQNMQFIIIKRVAHYQSIIAFDKQLNTILKL